MNHVRAETYDSKGNCIEVIDNRTPDDVLAYRLKMIRAAAAEQIAALDLGWMVEREVTGGTPVPQKLKDAAAAIRARSNDLESQANAAAAIRAKDPIAVCNAIEDVALR